MVPIQHLRNIDKRKRASQQVVFGFFSFLSYLAVVILFIILRFIILEGVSVTDWDSLTQAPQEGMTSGGIFPATAGTLYLVIGSSLISFPIDIMSGICMNEYTTNGELIRPIRITTNDLSDVLSVVFGSFGMFLFVSTLGWGDSIITGSSTLALMSLLLVIRTTEEALKSTDDSFRHGNLALGATRLQTIRRVVLLMAFPNIITRLVLSIGRVSGETIPILFTMTAYFLPQLPKSIFDQYMALPYHLYVIPTSGTDIETSQGMAYDTALVLIIVVLLVGLLANTLRSYFTKKVKVN